jgi:hypothetical protein
VGVVGAVEEVLEKNHVASNPPRETHSHALGREGYCLAYQYPRLLLLMVHRFLSVSFPTPSQPLPRQLTAPRQPFPRLPQSSQTTPSRRERRWTRWLLPIMYIRPQLRSCSDASAVTGDIESQTLRSAVVL